MNAENINSEKSKLNALRRGYYCPSFFKLGVETTYSLGDLNALQAQPAPFSTFFHEYIHYLQDITTSFGLANGCIIVDRMKYANHEVFRQGKAFEVPLSLTQDAITELNKEIHNVYLGDGYGVTPRTITVTEANEANSDVMLPSPYNKPVPKVVVNYESGDSKGSFDFGAYCIMETMTHIAQNRFHAVGHPAVPYMAAQLVAEMEYSPVGQNDLFVFALCDASLMTFQPGLTFYRALQYMREDKTFQPTNEREVYDYVLQHFKAEAIPLLSHFSWISGYATVQYLGYLTTAAFDNEKHWIHHVLKKAHELRVNNPYFLIDIIKQPQIESSQLVNVMNQLGTPLMINLDGDAWFHAPREVAHLPIQPDRFAAINEIFNLFEYGQTACELKPYCRNCPQGDMTDERCDKSPWERATDNQLCGYGAFWRTWGLSDYKPVNA